MKLHIIITAGGRGLRMGGPVPKQFMKLDKKTVLETTIEKFFDGVPVDTLVVTCPNDYMDEAQRILIKAAEGSKNKHRFYLEEDSLPFGVCDSLNKQFAEIEGDKVSLNVISGGFERQESVMKALSLLRTKGARDGDIVLVHDGVRPYVTEDLIMRVVEKTKEVRAVVPVLPVKYTIRHSTEGTLDRSNLFEVQTPQGFEFGILYKAFLEAEKYGFHGTDEAGIVEQTGIMPVNVIGEEENLKITVPGDMKKKIRTGTGFDVHRFQSGRRLILGGVNIPSEIGLLGHSDADVLVHALMDAMLGASALGDIGVHFPDSDPKYKDVSSMILLRKVNELIRQKGYRLVNADMTIICQKPRLSPYIMRMREGISEALQMDIDDINVKATTTEKLGFPGRSEGIASEAVCLIETI